MSRISLLPPEIKSLRLAQEKQSRLYFIFLIAVIFIVAINLFFMVYALITRADLQSLQRERAIVEEQAAELIEFEELFRKMGSRKIMLNDAMGTIPIWNDLLIDISETLPIGSQLSELRLNYGGASGTLIMRGSVNSHSGLAEMLDQLFTMSQLDDIKCQSSTDTGTGGRGAVQFQVDSVLLTGPPFLSDDEGGE